MKKLEKVIEDLSAGGPVMLIFHDASTELDYLSRELDTSAWMTSFPSNMHTKLLSEVEANKKKDPHFPIVIQDTQRLYAAFTANPQSAQVSLSRACKDEEIETQKMNNAGMTKPYRLRAPFLIFNCRE